MSVKRSSVVEVKETLSSSKFDRSFPEEVRKHPGGEKLYLCYQCGSCAGGCPIGKITDSYKPRQIIRMTLLGLKNEVLSSDSIWLCASCYTCQERCPQGVEIADLMLALRNIAVNSGYVPKAFVEQASMLIENGRLIALTGLAERKRSELGLESVSTASPETIKKIVSKTGFVEFVEKMKR